MDTESSESIRKANDMGRETVGMLIGEIDDWMRRSGEQVVPLSVEERTDYERRLRVALDLADKETKKDIERMLEQLRSEYGPSAEWP